MDRAFRYRTVLATLLLWQVSLVLPFQHSAPGAPLLRAASEVAVACPAHAMAVSAVSHSASTIPTHARAGSQPAKGKLPCCGTDACKCAVVSGALVASNSAPLGIAPPLSAPVPEFALPQILDRASEPLRPPI